MEHNQEKNNCLERAESQCTFVFPPSVQGFPLFLCVLALPCKPVLWGAVLREHVQTAACPELKVATPDT